MLQLPLLARLRHVIATARPTRPVHLNTKKESPAAGAQS